MTIKYFLSHIVFQLAEPIKLGVNAKPVQLPEAGNYPGDNATATLIGWGLDGVIKI